MLTWKCQPYECGLKHFQQSFRLHFDIIMKIRIRVQQNLKGSLCEILYMYEKCGKIVGIMVQIVLLSNCGRCCLKHLNTVLKWHFFMGVKLEFYAKTLVNLMQFSFEIHYNYKWKQNENKMITIWTETSNGWEYHMENMYMNNFQKVCIDVGIVINDYHCHLSGEGGVFMTVM